MATRKQVHKRSKKRPIEDLIENEEANAENAAKETEPRTRHNNAIGRIFHIVQQAKSKENAVEIIQCLKTAGFGGLLDICNWTIIHPFFVEWVVQNFEPDDMQIRISSKKVLKLTEADVNRVYGLPQVGHKIRLQSEGMETLCAELMIGGTETEIHVTHLEDLLQNLKDARIWAKAAILLIIHHVLCPSNSKYVSLKYARVLRSMESIGQYNWSKYVLDHVKKGIPSPTVRNPTADFHFLLINYMEHMGKHNPYLTGKRNYPSLGGWDVKDSNQALKEIHKYMGLDRGITVGTTKVRGRPEGPVLIPFQAASCPISEVPKLIDYCKTTITLYETCLATLQDRISGGHQDRSVSVEEQKIIGEARDNKHDVNQSVCCDLLRDPLNECKEQNVVRSNKFCSMLEKQLAVKYEDIPDDKKIIFQGKHIGKKM